MARRKPKALDTVDRTPDGRINNCALANGDEAKFCQMCGGDCPEARQTAPQEAVRHVALEGSRELYTVPSDSPLWGGSPPERMSRFKGAIVRLRPPEKATDDDVEEIRQFFLKNGAAKVVVLPRPRAELLPSKRLLCPGCEQGLGCIFAVECKRSKANAVGAREAVTRLVEESNSKDKDKLRALVEKVMGEVGL